jgi:hypothetical protein
MMLVPGGQSRQSRTPANANVRLQWSDSDELHQRGKELLTQPWDHVKTYSQSRLLLELIATRDILKGEEIVMDYGLDW